MRRPASELHARPQRRTPCARRAPGARRRGLTLVELLLATALVTLIMLAVFNLLDGFLSLWEKSERRRQVVETASGVMELLAGDLSSLEPGPRGDLLAEWVPFDTDGDGIHESKWPRLRLVRHASPAELARLQAGSAEKVLGEGLLEVAWLVLPAHPGTVDPALRAQGLLWRGERIVGDGALGFFDPKFIGSSGRPVPGSVHEVSSGILWVGMRFATQTSILRKGWRIGGGLPEVSASWDAWGLGRPDAQRHVWNEPGGGVPRIRGVPALPRRVLIELELERDRDLKRRTRLARFVTNRDTLLPVQDGERLPKERGSFVLVDGEWMEIVSVERNQANVVRGARGSEPAQHQPGAIVHFGVRTEREVPIPVHRENWNMGGP